MDNINTAVEVPMEQLEINVSELDSYALVVLTTVLKYARDRRDTRNHVLLLKEFYQLADLGDELSIVSFMAAVCEAQKAAVCAPNYDAETLHSWPVFDRIMVSKCKFEFTVNAAALDAGEYPLSLAKVREMLGLETKRAETDHRGRHLPKELQKFPAWFCANVTDLTTLDILKR